MLIFKHIFTCLRHIHMLLLLITATLASFEYKKMPTAELLRFCREEVKFVPFRVEDESYPYTFPEHFKIAMRDLWLFLFASVKVRDAKLNRNSYLPHLKLDIEYTSQKGLIASAEAINRDKCGRPDKGKILYNKNELNRTREEFIADLLHELMHLMGGFSESEQTFYYFFGKQNTQETGLIYGHIKQDDKDFYAVSPGVLEEVKKIDPKLKGAPIACRKMHGQRYPEGHWHKEKFFKKVGCDLMLPDTDHEGGLSRVTVAMINDFGWYEISYEKLSHLLEPTLEALQLQAKKKKK
jgi:hypothetical protein